MISVAAYSIHSAPARRDTVRFFRFLKMLELSGLFIVPFGFKFGGKLFYVLRE